MLRRTAAKAFTSGERPARERRALVETLRTAALERFVKDLHGAIEEALGAGGAGKEGAAGGGSAARAGADRAGPQVTKLRPLSEGVEFALTGPGAAVRFLDTLTGFVRVAIEEAGGAREEEILSVAPHCGIYRPIVKSAAAALSRRRTPFHFTTVRELARRYVGAAR